MRRVGLGLAAFGVLVAGAWWLGAFDLLSWEGLAGRRDGLQQVARARPILAWLTFMATYVVVAAASLPFATPLTLLAGVLFGFVPGVIAASFASTAGATLAAAISRWLLADLVRVRLARAVKVMDAGLERDGVAWLLAVRLVPVLPFFVVNLVLGLSRVPLRTIFWTSQLGMLPVTAVYVWAGSELGLVREVGDLMSPRLWAALVGLAVVPFGVRRGVDWWRGGTDQGS